MICSLRRPVLRVITFSVLIFLCTHALAEDKWLRQVCDAMVDTNEKAKCHQQLDRDNQLRKQSEERAAQAEKERIAREMIYGPKCKSDFACWVNELNNQMDDIDAQTSCQKLVERHAKYQYRWKDGWGALKFPRYFQKKEIGREKVVGYAGDAVQFQNGFGAWQPHSYLCWYDYSRSTVVGIDVVPGAGRY